MRKLVIILILLWPISLLAQGYRIEFQLTDVTDTTLTIGHRFANKTFIKDTLQVNKQGIAVYKGDEPLHGGIYLAILNESNYFEFLVGENQSFTLKTAIANPIAHMQVSGDIENQLYFDSQKYLRQQQARVKQWQKELEQAGAESPKGKQLQARIDSLGTELQTYWKGIVSEHPNTFYANLLQAHNGSRGAFFDNIDFSDPRLLYSDAIYTAIRVNMARDLNANKKPEVIIDNSRRIIEKAKANDEVFRYVLMYHLTFYTNFTRLGINKVFVDLADAYVASGEAHWLDSAAVADIMQQADTWRGSFTGELAPNIAGYTPQGKHMALHDVHADYTLLFFWKTGCGHCEEAADSLMHFYRTTNIDAEVVSFYTKTGKEQWVNYLNEHEHTDWVNLYDPDNESDFRNRYYVVSTPLLFVLDASKKIIAQYAGDENIIRLLQNMRAQEQERN